MSFQKTPLRFLVAIVLIGAVGVWIDLWAVPLGSIPIDCWISADHPIAPTRYLDYGGEFSEQHRGRLEFHNPQTHHSVFGLTIVLFIDSEPIQTINPVNTIFDLFTSAMNPPRSI